MLFGVCSQHQHQHSVSGFCVLTGMAKLSWAATHLCMTKLLAPQPDCNGAGFQAPKAAKQPAEVQKCRAMLQA